MSELISEIECEILGHVIYDARSLEKVVPPLRYTDFGCAEHRSIFEACARLYAQQGFVNLDLLAEALGAEMLALVGGPQFLRALVDARNPNCEISELVGELLRRVPA